MLSLSVCNKGGLAHTREPLKFYEFLRNPEARLYGQMRCSNFYESENSPLRTSAVLCPVRKIKGTRKSCSFFVYQIFFRMFIISSLLGTRGLVFVHLSRSAASAIALSFDSYSAYVKLGTASCTLTGIPISICIERM